MRISYGLVSWIGAQSNVMEVSSDTARYVTISLFSIGRGKIKLPPPSFVNLESSNRILAKNPQFNKCSKYSRFSKESLLPL